MTKLKRITMDLPSECTQENNKSGDLRFQFTLLVFLLVSWFGTAQSQIPGQPHRNQAAASAATPILSFTAPALATVTTDGTVKATLHLAGNADSSTLRVMLNTSDVTSWFSPAKCSSVPCDLTAQLSISSGMSAGWNSIHATLKGTTGNAGIANARFYYKSASSSAAVRTTTPRAANIANNATVADADTPLASSESLAVLPHAITIQLDAKTGLTLGSTPYTCTNNPDFTMFTVNRTTLAIENQQCLSASDIQSTPAEVACPSVNKWNPSTLSTYISTLTSNDMVILFSVSGAPLGTADMSAIGGTDFTGCYAPIVGNNYQIVGYGQAKPHEAYESYVNTGIPQFGSQDIQGSLINTGSNSPFYGFQPTDAPAFATQAVSASSSIAVGYPLTPPFGNTVPTNFILPTTFTQQVYSVSQSYPGYTGFSGFFVVMLSPLDLSLISQNVFLTGLAPNQIDLMNAYLGAAANGTVILMATQGSNPFGSLVPGTPTPSLATFCGLVAQMGGSIHACAALGSGGNGAFSFVGVMGTNPGSNKMYSSTYEPNQGDTGSLKGVFKRDHQFHLVPDQVSSLDTSTLPSGFTTNDLFDFALPTQVGSAAVTKWPMTDTAGHQAAYAYLSNVIVGKVLFADGTCSVAAAWCTDVRAWYTGNEANAFARLDLSSNTVYLYPGDTIAAANGFTNSDFSDVSTQLQAEFVYLGNVLNYQSWFNQTTNGSLLNTGTALSSAANEVNNTLIGEYAAITPPPISLAAGLNFLGSLSSILGAGFPPAAVAGNILKGASSAITLFSDSGQTENFTVVNVADLIANTDGSASTAASNYNLALQTQVGNYFSGVFSDWFKLQTFGILTSQPTANGWYVQDEDNATASNLSALLTANARINFYNQLLPQYFGIGRLPLVPYESMLALTNTTPAVTPTYINQNIFPWYFGINSTTPLGDNSYDILDSAANSSCRDYAVVILTKSWNAYEAQDFNNDPEFLVTSWENNLGDILMGLPSTADGLGNLNLSRNTFYDSASWTPLVSGTWDADYVDTPGFDNNISCDTGAVGTTLGVTQQLPTTLTIQPSAVKVSPDGSAKFAVTVQSSQSGTALPTGRLVILANGVPLSAAALVTGTSSPTTGSITIKGNSLSPGTYTVKVIYPGDSNYLGSSATTQLQVLGPAVATATTMNTPASASQGQQVTLQATVTAATGIPAGMVNFQDGTTSLGSAPLDSTGNASLSLSSLGAGSHSVVALFSPADTTLYMASQSLAKTLIVSPVSPDILLSLSTSSVAVPYGEPSAPVALTVTSFSSFAGQVSFACVGLPLGMACSFSPSQAALPASGTMNISLTISQNAAVSSASIVSRNNSVGLFELILSVLLAFRISRGRRLFSGAVWMWTIAALSFAMLSGCSGSSANTGGATRQTGTTNILVTATSGGVTKSIPLTVNVQ